jgi:hypothetical protein
MDSKPISTTEEISTEGDWENYVEPVAEELAIDVDADADKKPTDKRS